jgi:hypothetical protein
MSIKLILSKEVVLSCVFAQVIRGASLAARQRWQGVGGEAWPNQPRLYRTFRSPPRYLERTLSYPVDPVDPV